MISQRRLSTLQLLLIAATVALCSAQPTIQQFPVGFETQAITTGPDGALWFTSPSDLFVGRLTTSGMFSDFIIPSTNEILLARAIITGSDGNLWIPFGGHPVIVSPFSGVAYELDTFIGSDVWQMAIGPDGAIWMANAAVGRLTTPGGFPPNTPPQYSQFSVGNYTTLGITLGSDANLWFSASDNTTQAGVMGRITTAGVVNIFPLPAGLQLGPTWIATGPDGAVWFAAQGSSGTQTSIGKITPDGTITMYPLPNSSAYSFPAPWLVAGPDGAMWFAGTGAIGRITTDGSVTTYAFSGQGGPMTVGSDGALWFADTKNAVIWRAGTTPIPSVVWIAQGGVLNAASFAKNAQGFGTPVAPGSIVAIFGNFPGATTASASSIPYPTNLGNITVTFNGTPAPLQATAPSGAYPFVTAQVPFEVQGSSTAQVVVSVNDQSSLPATVTIVPSAPGIFTIPPTGQGNAVLVFSAADGTATIAAPTGANLGLPTAPIPRGTKAFFYATGLGSLTPPIADGVGGIDGTTHEAVMMPVVTVGGISAEVDYWGPSGYPGVYQINVVVPLNAPTGDGIPLVVTSYGTSNTAIVSVM